MARRDSIEQQTNKTERIMAYSANIREEELKNRVAHLL